MAEKRRGIVVFAFGVPATIPPNQLLGKVASERAKELQAPVYTQIDVPIKEGVDVTYIPQREGESPPSTLRIAMGAIEWAKNRGITKLHVIAAPPHLWRVLRDLHRALKYYKGEIELIVCDEVKAYSNAVWFSPASTQRRTRSRWCWWPREIVIRAMPSFVYKHIAK